MASSLDRLVENLHDKADTYNDFNHVKISLWRAFGFTMQTRFVFPYEILASIDKLDYAGLPPKYALYSTLKQAVFFPRMKTINVT